MATDDATKRLERMAKLLDTLRELQAKTYEITEELQKLAGGQDATGDVLKRLEFTFISEWQRRYGSTYVFQYAKDRPHWKRLIKLAPEADIMARVVAYLHDEDPFLVRARHPFPLFVSRFNTLVPAVSSDLTLSAPVADCKHTPRCASDQEHTRRRSQELRGVAS